MLIEYVRNGRQREVSSTIAKVLIGRKLARVVESAAPELSPTPYENRMMQAAEPAPYGLKLDGTPRKRPGRQKVE